ncbi:MAG: MBL fold metallo-hydrolase [Candidatus Latescibacterota bacterium]|nr:MBL fold metallo-hydrolase [Candidatus Latescibacterota bacterium]
MFDEIASGVYSAQHQVAEGKNAIVVGTRGALAIDGGTYAEEGQAMADFIRAKGWGPDRLALTHGHADHILGAGPLAGGEIYAHAKTPGVIRRQIPGWARRQGRAEEEVAANLVWPTVLYQDELRIDLGGKTVWFFPTPGHSEDGVSALVIEDQLLIGGDAVVTGIVPAIGDGDSRVLENSLCTLAKLEIETLIPGHGPEVYGRDAVRGWIEWEAGYLAQVRGRVRELLDAGTEEEAAIDAVGFEEFVGDRLPADRHKMPTRHRNTVAVIAAEEIKSSKG